MSATILMHPRLEAADTETRERLTEHLTDLLAHEELLLWHAAPEAEATYWRLFGDLETGQATPRGNGATRRVARRTVSRIRAAQARRERPPLSAPARREFLAIHRRLVRRLHPQLDHHAANRGYLWSMVRRACRDGDLVRLRECEAVIRDEGSPAKVLTEHALSVVLADARMRIRRLEQHFPLNLRTCMADPEWVAGRRAALRRRLPEPVRDAKRGEPAAVGVERTLACPASPGDRVSATR